MNHDLSKAERAREPLRMYYPDDPESSAIDLVADILHYAASIDLKPNEIVRMALVHYEAEVRIVNNPDNEDPYDNGLTPDENGEYDVPNEYNDGPDDRMRWVQPGEEFYPTE